MVKILLVEDNYDFGNILKNGLKELNPEYIIELRCNGLEALNIIKDFQPDIIVSDVSMPVMDGIEMVKNIRKFDGNIPILFTSGLTSSQDVLNGFKIGINNYIKKPFTVQELNAYIMAILNLINNYRFKSEEDCYQIGKFTFYTKLNKLVDNIYGNSIHLRYKESQILKLLANNMNEVVEKNVILKYIWKSDDYFVGRSFDVMLTKIRKHLKDDPHVKIETIRGVGFILIYDQNL